jgi:hypothetical protein
VARPLGPALSVSPALSSLSTFPVDFAKPWKWNKGLSCMDYTGTLISVRHLPTFLTQCRWNQYLQPLLTPACMYAVQ